MGHMVDRVRFEKFCKFPYIALLRTQVHSAVVIGKFAKNYYSQIEFLYGCLGGAHILWHSLHVLRIIICMQKGQNDRAGFKSIKRNIYYFQ